MAGHVHEVVKYSLILVIIYIAKKKNLYIMASMYETNFRLFLLIVESFYFHLYG